MLKIELTEYEKEMLNYLCDVSIGNKTSYQEMYNKYCMIWSGYYDSPNIGMIDVISLLREKEIVDYSIFSLPIELLPIVDYLKEMDIIK